MAVLGRKPGGRAARRKETTQRILTATRELLAQGNGFGDLSIEQIAARAGISRTAFYDYFDDKRALLIRMVRGVLDQVFREGEERTGAPGTEPHTLDPQAMRAQAGAMMRFAREYPGIYCAVVEASAYDDIVAHFWRGEILASFIDNLEAGIEQGQKSGSIRPVPPRAAAQVMVLTVVQSVYDQVRPGDSAVTDDELVEAVAAVCIRAVHGDDAEED